MTGDEQILKAVTAVVELDLAGFTGLRPQTARGHVVAAAGPVWAEGFGGGPFNLWMTVHELGPELRLTAWYALGNEPARPVGLEDAVLWIERPIRPEQVAALALEPKGHRPDRAPHLLVWPDRGLCLHYSRRSGLPTLLLAFAPLSVSAFDRSPMAWHD